MYTKRQFRNPQSYNQDEAGGKHGWVSLRHFTFARKMILLYSCNHSPDLGTGMFLFKAGY